MSRETSRQRRTEEASLACFVVLRQGDVCPGEFDTEKVLLSGTEECFRVGMWRWLKRSTRTTLRRRSKRAILGCVHGGANDEQEEWSSLFAQGALGDIERDLTTITDIPKGVGNMPDVFRRSFQA